MTTPLASPGSTNSYWVNKAEGKTSPGIMIWNLVGKNTQKKTETVAGRMEAN